MSDLVHIVLKKAGEYYQKSKFIILQNESTHLAEKEEEIIESVKAIMNWDFPKQYKYEKEISDNYISKKTSEKILEMINQYNMCCEKKERPDFLKD